MIAAVVDSDAAKRTRCIDAARGSGFFKRTIGMLAVQDLLCRYENGEFFDVVFLGSALPPKTITDTVNKLKSLHEDTACIVALGARDGGADSIATGMLGGIDGFLSEPFSVELLSDIARIALQLKKQNEENRTRLAVTILINEASKYLDAASVSLFKGLAPGHSLRKLRGVSSKLENLSPAAKDLYYEVLEEIFSQCQVPLERRMPSEPSSAPTKRGVRHAARWEERSGKLNFTVKKE